MISYPIIVNIQCHVTGHLSALQVTLHEQPPVSYTHLYFNESPIEQLGEVDSLRDVYDMALIRLATRRNIPIFEMCIRDRD